MDKNKKFGIGLISALFFLMVLIYFFSLSHQNKEQTVVESQLQLIQEKKFTEAYYSYTSKDFQEATSLENFKKFIANFPLFSEKHKLKFESIDKDGEIHALLNHENEHLKVVYTLSKDNNDLLIRAIEVLEGEDPKQPLQEFDPSAFQEPINQFMIAIKNGDPDAAYKMYTSQAFQEATSLKDLKSFLKEYTIFSNFAKLNFQKLTFDNNLGHYSVDLISKDASKATLKYDLIKENGTWKILQVQISDTSAEE